MLTVQVQIAESHESAAFIEAAFDTILYIISPQLMDMQRDAA